MNINLNRKHLEVRLDFVISRVCRSIGGKGTTHSTVFRKQDKALVMSFSLQSVNICFVSTRSKGHWFN
jgi:hypothetical protein